jgi:hypothetical protein
VYALARFITGKEIAASKLKTALVKTHLVFQNELSCHLKELEAYKSYLKKKAKEEPCEEKPVFKIRQAITEWNLKTAPFIQLCKKHGDHSMLKPFENDIGMASQLLAMQPVIDLEGMLKGPLPLVLLRKLIKGRILTSVDKQALEDFIKMINAQKSPSVVNTVHEVLACLISLYGKDKAFATLPEIEVLLCNHGCTIFDRDDLQMCAFRESVKEGDKIALNGNIYTLSREITSAPKEKNKKRVFIVAEERNLVLVIAENRAILPILHHINKPPEGFTSKIAQFKEIATDGSCALRERLYKIPIPAWKSSGGVFSEGDKRAFEILKMLIISFIKTQSTPPNFSIDSLMVDKHGDFMALGKQTRAPFDFIAMEQLAISLANGNETILQRLMVDTELTKHKVAKSFKDVFNEALNGDHIAAEVSAAFFQIDDPKVLETQKQFFKAVRTLYVEIYTEIKKKRPSTQEENIKRAFKMTHYNSHRSSTLHPNLKDLILNALSQKF